MQTRIIAHRGASADAPENTMPAFRLAYEQGAEMLELDVRATVEGEIVIFHDETTERWNNVPQPISTLTFAQVQQLDIGGARVPRLAELLEWLRTTDLILNIEIKVPGIEAQVAELVRGQGLVERVIISSFNLHVLEVMRKVAPDLTIGVLMDTESRVPYADMREAWPLPTLRRLEARAWHPAWRLPQLDQLIPQVRNAGFAVYVWTVDDPQVMRRLLALQVDGIITNRPAVLREVRAAWLNERQGTP